ncbi:methylase [Pseudoflavonifractor sp. 524-17]|uniref:DNA methyltransferase n=1 Tax=Pseudoflavonifractor sp. 524-17 TaxID=2304577 RepID=UPI00137A2750|nr:DNA methyltransferase [Pseudoflavonifractor sp. 524-17]NCE65098.1 methylase [Pseudoflavonifractor sp. 524-17]
MTNVERRTAAARFAADWKGRGDEKQETQAFWLTLLQKIYGVEEPEKYISFEVPVKLDHTSFIDGYIESTRVLIEQKGRDIDLRKGYKQSDGSMLTPYQQARRYAGYLPYNQVPRWIIVCNFQEFQIHDMNRPNDEPEVLKLADLEKEFHRLQFLVDTGSEHIKKEMEISLQAGELVGVLYDALLKQYKDPNNLSTLQSLNKLCVRLVFCLYAEDAGIFGGKSMFHDYLENHRSEDRRALINLFRVLDQDVSQRDNYLDDDLAVFPYVNGGLFADENIEIPRLGDEVIDLILHRGSEDFDWSAISPTIFGAVFESTLNPETRRSGGMHYTSIENIHKLIDPLFLDGLKAEFAEIGAITVERTRKAKLEAFQRKLAGLKFLDPACGSGNFLTETYISLRRLENETISLLHKGQIMLDMGNPIQVSISQFYGIEINDFAVTVAKTALWIAESQMMKETEDVVHMSLDFLPLKSYANIVEGNALRTEWTDVIPKHELDYIMGNPPFVGHQWRTKEQAEDLEAVCHDIPKCGKLDYVCGWYNKAADYMQGTNIHAAFVSTNSISQGESVGILWKPLFAKNVQIEFAHRTFVWTSEAKDRAAVHCVIVGFTCGISIRTKLLFESGQGKEIEHINGYLLEAPDVFIQSRGKTLTSGLPEMSKGSQPTDGGNLIFSVDEREELIKKYPMAAKFLKRYISADDYINNKWRYCLWLKGVSPGEYRNIPPILKRLEMVVECRKKSPTASVQRDADTPMLFTQIRQPETKYLAMPEVSSSRRRYIPFGYMNPDTIASNMLYLVSNATPYMFGVMTSNVHMAWLRIVGGRLKSDYRYTPAVYNNFPWPTPTDAQKIKIEQTAQAILDARALYPDASLADLYDETTMPPELRKAHQQNDKAVMEAYGFWGKLNSEPACVAELMKMYQQLVTKES